METLLENASKNENGNKGNKFSAELKEISCYCYIRGGKHFYLFLSKNLILPELSTIRKFMSHDLNLVYEGQWRFDEIAEYIVRHNMKKEIGVFEDGTKINERVDYDVKSNSLLGLVSPIEASTGLPRAHYFDAKTADQINYAIKNHPRASYLQVILVQPNDKNAPALLLGYYGTNNKMTSNDVLNRYKFINREFKKRDIKVICHGSDGDSRFLCAQKRLINFGNPSSFSNFKLAGNINSEVFGMQDALHDGKKLCDRLYDKKTILIMGNRVATVSHLIIVFKKYHKSQHGLIRSDIDCTDHMNYA